MSIDFLCQLAGFPILLRIPRLRQKCAMQLDFDIYFVSQSIPKAIFQIWHQNWSIALTMCVAHCMDYLRVWCFETFLSASTSYVEIMRCRIYVLLSIFANYVRMSNCRDCFTQIQENKINFSYAKSNEKLFYHMPHESICYSTLNDSLCHSLTLLLKISFFFNDYYVKFIQF